MNATADATLLRAAEAAAAELTGLDEAARERFAHRLLAPVASHALHRHAAGERVLGIYGAQGSGKSTLAAGLEALLREHAGLRVANLSLDDFYMTQAHRMRVAARLHPLFETRGPPGTHDVPLLLRTLDALLAPASDGAVQHTVPVPRFDKGADDRAPEPDGLPAPVDLVVLEGWCLGVPAQPAELLTTPCNDLERQRDASGRFRRCVNHRLAHDYAALTQRVGWLLALLVDSFETSCAQRLAQEHRLRARTGRGMSDAQVAEFMQRYERVSRWALDTMAERADLCVRVGRDHAPRQDVPWLSA
ncbi:MAG: hypothetical protein R3B40_03790 [Polyangiales bacterium]|nr:hypothetical protein [Myxococcales bacterium]